MAYMVFSKVIGTQICSGPVGKSFIYTVSLETVFLPQLSKNELFCHRMTVVFKNDMYCIFR